MASVLYPTERKDIVSRAGRSYGQMMDWLSVHPLFFASVFFITVSIAFAVVAVFGMSFAQ